MGKKSRMPVQCDVYNLYEWPIEVDTESNTVLWAFHTIQSSSLCLWLPVGERC